jgi:23S rRNA pseudouridine1911/1915/1917 synthase
VRDPNVLVQIALSSLARADRAILSELKRKHPELSRAALKILFREKRVRLLAQESADLGRALSASDDLFPGTHLIKILDWNPEADLSPEPSHGTDTEQLPVLYEDEDLLILHKSSGTPSVPLKPHETKTAVSSAIRYLKNTQQGDSLQRFLEIGKASGHPLEAGLLHRLDTGTSGALAFAKNQTEFDRIRALWKTSKIRKFYRAITLAGQAKVLDAKLSQLPFQITTPIGHDPKSAKRMQTIQNPRDLRNIRGKPLDAITHVLSARRVEQNSIQLFDLRIEIETGVMHQIRVHLASMGLPILGDPLYGPVSGPYGPVSGPDTIAAPRLLLHHERLELPLRSGAMLSVQAGHPSDWP